ncbi:universal stress protein [Stieleria sp. TO1_6]|uniref:universal stress protein n=1 Tax=Stieleria tagensis TaxID=2956795 RepID=UPI00209B27D0|nr:universal stress protein [Stieleria tagensis]MCO8121423.1 universal stress protein [Stieleria tagensis]
MSTTPARFILHPTDFSASSQLAFAHALRLATTNKANLSLLHVGEDSYEDWDRFPAVRKTLERWKLIEPGTARREIQDKIGVGVEKVIAEQKDVVSSIVDYLDQRPIDFLVLSTHGRDGISAWIHPSTAEKIAHKAHVPTLFVPTNSHGCVSLETGEVTMRRILVPVDHQPRPDEAIDRAMRALQAYGTEDAKLTLLHVGSSTMPSVAVPDGPWQVEQVVIPSGDPATEITAFAAENKCNVIVMVTEGVHGFLDVLRGTTTDKVLRHAPCPLLAIPS